jgi:dolichyl-phosphate-mannose-protein mannosyltransferase
MNFFAKFFELQIAMLRSNAGLTDSHPYATGPLNWPFLASGISFWTGPAEELEQVYLIGNIIGWWICVMTLALFIGMIGADQFAQRRGLHPIAERTFPLKRAFPPFFTNPPSCHTAAIRNRLYNSGGFFMLAWIYHYVPFFSMSRQLFLHHYLPAHLCSALVAGAVFHFALSESINYPISIATSRTRRRPSERARTNKKMVGVLVGTIVALAAMYVFMMPLTYGTPGLDPDAVNRRRLFSSWTLVCLFFNLNLGLR